MKYITWLVVGGSLVAGIALVGGVASAQTMPPQNGHGFGMGNFAAGNHAPGVVGTVSSISGTTITLASKGFGRGQSTTTATTYTVNAASATVTKNGTSSSLSAVNVGDMIFVQGTVSGSNVTATTIRDGVPPMGGPGGMRGFRNASGTWNGSSTKPRLPGNVVQGNGEPVVGGSVTAVSGDTLTVTTAANKIAYTVDVTNATVDKGGSTSTISGISVGDNVLIQGSVSGTSVTASSVIDQGAPHVASSSNGNGNSQGLGGFMSAVGGFFHHLFGFF